MIGYGSDMYVQSYEGDGWSWGGQAWGTTFDAQQVQFDCSTWAGYQQQQQQQQQSGWGEPQQQAVNHAAPRAGPELLTELRLAELKRLIDRDAKALRASSEGLEIESSDSADCPTRAPASNEDSPNKEDSASAHSAPQAPKAHDSREAETTQVSASEPVASESGLGAPDAPPPPGLDAPEEKCFAAVADFLPESRNYGEMPVRIGEEVYVSGEALDGWIFGVKRSNGVEDEGWLPASALHIEDLQLEFEAPRARHASSQSSGTSQRGREQQQPGPSAPAGSRNARKGDRLKGKGDGKGYDAAWHEHGNWWSRQRHLKADGQDADGHIPVLPHPRGTHPNDGGRNRKAPAPPPPPPAWSDEWDPASRPAASSRRSGRRGGKSGGGNSGNPPASTHDNDPPRPKDRQARQRPALTSMLDRLNKPLVAPKTHEDDQ